jgi:hypothetical protein
VSVPILLRSRRLAGSAIPAGVSVPSTNAFSMA